MWKKVCITAMSLLLTASLAAGCGNNDAAGSGTNDKAGGKETAKPKMSNEPVELVFYSHWLNMSNDYFNEIIGDPVHKKFPNISLKFLLGNSNDTLIDQLLTTGTVPDIIYASQANALILKDQFKIIGDMSDLIKRDNMNLNKFEPVNMYAIKSYDDSGKILALPFALSPWALWYNKDIFDKFGVPYPKNGLTWDETAELSRQLTRKDGEVQYIGALTHNHDKMMTQLSLEYVDPKSLKPVMQTDGWKKLFSQFKKLYEIPGVNQNGEFFKYNDWFMKDKILAMLPGNNIIDRLVESEKSGLNWDVAQFPSYPDLPNTYNAVQADSLMLSSTTKHKEEAWQVISYLTSDEVQMNLSKKGKESAVVTPEVRKAFASEYPSTKNKHLSNIFLSHSAKLTQGTVYDGKIAAQVRKKWNAVMEGTEDINTALRESDEAAAQVIADEGAK